MTLLEVLVAITILASLTVIVAMLWSQTKRWTDEAGTHDTALRLQRALDLLDCQWERRLVGATLADGGSGGVSVDDTRLEFVTTESVLFPGWPIVRASYIATEDAAPIGQRSGWRLVYEETRLGTTINAGNEAAGADNTDDQTNLRRSTLVGLTARPAWSAVLSEAQLAEWEAAHGQPLISGAEPGVPAWIGLTDRADRGRSGPEHATNPEAVRLDGTTEEGGFRWALVGLPLR
jgi:type II secretory pathway component PulJ